MSANPIIHEKIRFGRGGQLAGVLSYPASERGMEASQRAVLLCSPHPNFAGDMENNVIAALAERFAIDGVALRFDYRGVGESQIDLPRGVSALDYWDRIEQTHDYVDALADTAEALLELHRVVGADAALVVAGYSFGALTAARVAIDNLRVRAVACIAPPLTRIGFDFLANCPTPCLMLSGSKDFVYDESAALRLAATAGRSLMFERMEQTDHFFRGMEHALADRIETFLRRCL